MAQLNFDARTVVPDAGQQDPVPAGWYSVVIDKSEVKPTKDGAGQRLEMQFKIIDGQYANRRIFEGFNIQHANAQTKEIAYKQLSAIAHAVNHLLVADSQELHDKPMKVKVILKPQDGQYAPKNEIKAYKPINFVPDTPVGAPGAFTGSAGPAPMAPPAFGPVGAAPGAGAAGATPWAAPATAQPWAPPAGPAATAAPVAATVAPVAAAPAATAPVAAGTVATPPWAAAPVAEAAPVAAAPAAAAVPGAGLAPPPWAAQPTA